jgi:ribonuclease P protein component
VLPKENRLTKRKDFQRVFQRGKGIKENSLALKWVRNNLKVSRFAFIVSQKVSKKAVLRNKLRRKLREKARLDLPKLQKGLDAIIIVSPGAEKKGGKELAENLNKLLLKAQLIRKSGRSI